MFFSPLVLLFLPLAWSAALHTRQTSRDDCSTAMKLVQESSSGIIEGQAAFDCLESFPFDATKADNFLSEIRKYFQFQSTLEALKRPPDTYRSVGVDIVGGLDKISNTTYKNQFQFDSNLRSLIRSANDGHFFILPCSLGPFDFFRQTVGLAPVSKDGLEKPDIYVAYDVEALLLGSTCVSPITTINDQDVIEYLETAAALLAFQDPDARWNSLFASTAALATGSTDIAALWGQFTSNAGLWPGVNNTHLGFKNGSTLDLPTLAQYNYQSIFPTSTALYQAACMPDEPNIPRRGTRTKRNHNAEVSPTATTGPPGFPKPFVRDPYNQISGYNLDEDTAVMFIPTFEGGSGFPVGQDLVFGQVATEIVNTAIASGRTKLIIDLSQNGGGDIARSFDLFKLFFPSQTPYSATRFRRHDASDLLARSGKGVNSTAAGADPFDFQGAVNPAQDAGFSSVDDFLDGESQLGVNVTSLYANFNYTLLSLLNIDNGPIRGFGGAPINKTQPYAPEDILVITDGICSSTCTTFANLMINTGGVRSLTFGGRPRFEPMQVMGGVRGAQSLAFSDLDTEIAEAIERISDNRSIFSQEQVDLAQKVWPRGLQNLPLPINGGGVNLRNAYQEGADHLPLQFDYQASDCRLFYTAQNLVDPSSIWADAKAAIWGDRGCVKNSTGGKGSLADRTKKTNANSNSTGDNQTGGASGSSIASDDQSTKIEDGASSGAQRLHLGGGLLALSVLASVFAVIMRNYVLQPMHTIYKLIK
ncbi:hypothetical protein F5B22DRAFT_101443 [Xylaria bambusicola]|uniref:uncharacterized protein n=1 Tax=Xylaria bambusicola TaxID=326684 RepID=UPI00200867E3|nr:uncharacterized protein F5B22DRAFT_101443 [Xylaria bambusicola]KAI0517821.1 hypothetical protein F5B22DRAFT_101443 [Xylaria bambusicola]